MSGFTDIVGFGGTQHHQARGVSPNGVVVVGSVFTPEGLRAFRWTTGSGMQNLGVLSRGTASGAYAVSGNGETVGGIAQFSPSPARAFLWRESIGMVDLTDYLSALGANTAGWRLERLEGISHDGRSLAGLGYVGGQKRAFLVTGLPKECRADMNGDGLLNIFDFLEFQNLFAAEDPRADFNHDGIFDFIEFQNAFAAGCP